MGNRFFNFRMSSSAAVFGVKVYGGRSDAWWHKALIKPTYRWGNWVRNAIWQVRYRIDPRHRYHMIDTRLEPGYYDVDTLMLNGMFSLLRRYVEDEMGGADEIMRFNEELTSHADPHEPEGASAGQAKRQGEAVTLYKWWMVDLPAMRKRKDDLLQRLYGGENRRMSFETVEGTDLRRVVLRPFDEDEEAMHQEMHALEEKIDREEQEMLHRLIDIRGSLWT